MPQDTKGIPSGILAQIIRDWVKEYGPTYPLYGKESVRHDISGSVRPLLSSTELPHEKILAERSGVSKRTIVRILSGETKWVSEEVADRLITAMDKNYEWYDSLAAY